MTTRLDHLVVLAASLEQGVAWSERVLGVTPAAGGTHPRMGTHNRLLRLGDDGAHPCDSLPTAGISLRALRVAHPEAQRLSEAYAAIGLAGIALSAGAPSLVATLDTPKGIAELASSVADINL